MPIVASSPLVVLPPLRKRPSRRELAFAAAPSPPETVPSQAAAPKPTLDYEVGNCKPPKHSQFKPGQSGNPKGRPKGAKSFDTIVREAMLKPVLVRTSTGTRKISTAEALVMKATESGTKGDLRAIDKLLGWYERITPSQRPEEFDAQVAQSTSATDEAILAKLRQIIVEDLEDVQPEQSSR